MEEFKVVESRPSIKKVMRIKEFCSTYGVGTNKAYNLAHRKDAPVIFNGTKILFVRSRVDDWINSMIGERI